jgi:1-deoxy-D-xylulose-5-phosphate reductoisomerase
MWRRSGASIEVDRVPRGVVVLGSTGSIGVSTLDVCRNLGDEVRVVGLVAGTRWQDVAAQARAHRVPRVAVSDPRPTSA